MAEQSHGRQLSCTTSPRSGADDTQSYVELPRRVTQASVKSFQIVRDNDRKPPGRRVFWRDSEMSIALFGRLHSGKSGLGKKKWFLWKVELHCTVGTSESLCGGQK